MINFVSFRLGEVLLKHRMHETLAVKLRLQMNASRLYDVALQL